ncbi:predicted protein [Chaetoceros tenuissimus]|uniref:J domain-containing protein n=1 Tax=Chaetoceros tenuissimus TaxID=426638 RepID=A0AAD3CMV6_9STRA|nr:predicted protein [Chaetoceros tenuissimus]
MANTQNNFAESKFADLLLDQVEAVLTQDPCEDSLYNLLKIASPNIERSTISRDHQKHFKKLKFQVHPDRHTGNSERANKIFQSMADFYEEALGSTNRNHTRKEKREKRYPTNFESSEKWTYIHIRRMKCISKEKSVGSQVAIQCINARGSIVHGKTIDVGQSITKPNKSLDHRSAKEVFDMYGGSKALSSQDEIKTELMTRGPVVSTSFELSAAFLSSVEGRDHFFHLGLKEKVHDVLITGWKHTSMGEVWQICPLIKAEYNHVGEECFNIGFGQYNIDRTCVVPTNTFEDYNWQKGPYFKADIWLDRDTWYSWKYMDFSINSKQLEELTEVMGGNIIASAKNKRFTLQDSRKKAHSRSCYLQEVTLQKNNTAKPWRISVVFI